MSAFERRERGKWAFKQIPATDLTTLATGPIKPVEERRDNRLGRVIMKLKSVKFLEKDK